MAVRTAVPVMLNGAESSDQIGQRRWPPALAEEGEGEQEGGKLGEGERRVATLAPMQRPQPT